MSIQKLIDKIATYKFKCEAGSLLPCIDYQKLCIQALLNEQENQSLTKERNDLRLQLQRLGTRPYVPAQVPEGFVLVPREPTPDMIDDGRSFLGKHIYGAYEVANIYRDMIAACPDTMLAASTTEERYPYASHSHDEAIAETIANKEPK